jgi:hypothetical protein
MARLRVIVLDRPAPDVYRYVFWADVPAARQAFYANPTAVSAWKDALAADLTALRNGSVVEKVDSLKVPAGSTLAQAQAFLAARHADYQAQVTAYNPWVRYGTTYDGASWTNGGVS